ncbi:hypothetical protein FGIG_10482 [Fasciola gigantica]|uniref:Uncharacterized protein n=1 Tax=Fasciola gigantica TaxID=46835 RepID=A0A504Y5G7_FASGI|nr:hypothetical protein FGIG_10482 [Fasciola gigantica]
MHTLTAPNPDSPKNSGQCIPKKAVTFIRPQSIAPASSVPLTIQIPPRIVRSSSTSSEVDVTTADSWSEVTSSVEPNEDEDAFDQLIGPEQNVSLSSLSKLVRMNSSTTRRYPDQLRLIATPMEMQNPDQPDQSACVIHIYNRLEDVDHTRRSVEKLSINRSPNRTSPNQSRARQHHTSPVPISSTTINLAHSSDQIQHISSNNQPRNRSQCTGKRKLSYICFCTLHGRIPNW